MDELRHVLDGVDIVVRRRADEAHAGGGVAHGGDDLVDLPPGQLAPFSGLGALDDLDLQLVGVREVLDRYPEAPGGHLLDGRALGIAIGFRRPARGVLAPFPGVRFATQAIHGDREGLVGLGRDGAIAHGAGGEALYDVLFAFHLV